MTGNRNSIMVGGRIDSTRLNYITITNPTEAATFSDLNISSLPIQIPAHLPFRKVSRKITASEDDDSSFMSGKPGKKQIWSCHMCGRGEVRKGPSAPARKWSITAAKQTTGYESFRFTLILTMVMMH